MSLRVIYKYKYYSMNLFFVYNTKWRDEKDLGLVKTHLSINCNVIYKYPRVVRSSSLYYLAAEIDLVAVIPSKNSVRKSSTSTQIHCVIFMSSFIYLFPWNSQIYIIKSKYLIYKQPMKPLKFSLVKN